MFYYVSASRICYTSNFYPVGVVKLLCYKI